jgi:hypothetical protein
MFDHTFHQSDPSIPNQGNIVTFLLDVDNKLILNQLDHYVKELSSDWKGKIMFLCHVVYDVAKVSATNLTTCPPQKINICDYIGGQVFGAKRLYFSPMKYPPPTAKVEMLSVNAQLCMGWTKLCQELMVAAHKNGNPVVCNGSQKSKSDNRGFRCGMLYRITRPSKAMEISPDK